MAKPQAEAGHIDIANEIAEKLATINLSAYEWRVLWVIWRKTWGWHKKIDAISLSQFLGATGIKYRTHLIRAIKELLKKKIIAKTEVNGRMLYAFEKDYDSWVVPNQVRGVPNKVISADKKGVPNKVHVPNEVTGSTYLGHKPVPNKVHTKEIKETIQKKIYMSLATLWSEKIFKIRSHTNGRISAIKARLEDGYSPEQLSQAIINYSEDEWHQQNKKWKDFEDFMKPKTLDQWLAIPDQKTAQKEKTRREKPPGASYYDEKEGCWVYD